MTIVAETCAGQRYGTPHPEITHDEITCPFCLLLWSIMDDVETVECDLRMGALASAEESGVSFRNVEKELARLLPDAVSDIDSEIHLLLNLLRSSIDETAERVAEEVTALENLQ